MLLVWFKPDLWRPTGFLQCFDTVGLVIWPVQIVPEMTYNVLSGTLNATHSIIQRLTQLLIYIHWASVEMMRHARQRTLHTTHSYVLFCYRSFPSMLVILPVGYSWCAAQIRREITHSQPFLLVHSWLQLMIAILLYQLFTVNMFVLFLSL